MTSGEPPRDSTSRAPFILTLLGIVAALVWGRSILVPIALSLYAGVLLLPAVEYLCRLKMPRFLAAGWVMLLVAGGVVAVVEATVTPAREWIDRSPQVFSDVERKIRPLRRAAAQLDKVAEHAERIAGTTTSPAAAAAPVAVQSGEGWLSKTSSFLVPVFAGFFLTYFVLACGPPLLHKLAAGRVRSVSGRRLLSTMERSRREMGRYLGTLALVNTGLGLATATLAALFDLPNPLLWGVMAGVLNFIPYAGSAVTLCVLSLVALMTHDNAGPAVGIAVSYLGLATIEGQLVQPLAIGQRLSLNPLAVFLALWVGGGLWGVAGMLLATPVLLTVKIACRRMPQCRSLVDFLGALKDPPIALRARAKARAWRRSKRRRKKGAG